MRAEVVVRTQFVNCVGPQICLSGLWQYLVATERHLWLNLSSIKRKILSCGCFYFPSGLFGDAVKSVVERFQESAKQAAAFQILLPTVLISPGLLSGRSPKHLSRAWLIVLPLLNNGDMGSALNPSLRSIKWTVIIIFTKAAGKKS